MNVWILTIGSSDVQLKPKNNWKNLNTSGRSQLKPDRGFSPSKLPDSDRLRVPARVMGVIYSQPQASLADLDFPLIDNFINKLKAQEIIIDKVILILSDQSVFPVTKRSQKHPYWQDTCTLQPILEKYLAEQWKDVSPDLDIKPLLLEATSEEEGLDNWDAVLTLVQKKFASPNLNLPKDTTVYVSHQAGTPAISSAVQFCSLAKFGDRVKFLVSNEYNPVLPEKPLDGSSYLHGIRIQEAKALLGEGSYNYAGVEALIEDYIQENEDIKTLLSAAKNWNVARFTDFRDCLKHHPKFTSEVAERTKENWWWIAYEEAYLAVIREKQDNIVEAFFHSFRAFEYIFAEWGSQKLSEHIEEGEDDSVSLFKETILADPRFIGLTGDRKKAVSGIQRKFKTIADKRERGEKIKSEDQVEFGFFNICSLFKAFNYVDYRGSCSCLNVFFGKGNVRDRRNAIVHQVKGLSFIDLCVYWGISPSEDLEDKAKREKSIREWKIKLKDLLNCVVKEDFPEGFSTLEDASLMAKVHMELERAIAHL